MTKSTTSTCSNWGKKPRTKQCPKGTNLNKKSNRCIKRNGSIGSKKCLTNCKDGRARDHNKFTARCLKNCKPFHHRNKQTNRCNKPKKSSTKKHRK